MYVSKSPSSHPQCPVNLTSISRDEVQGVEVREVVATVHLNGLQQSNKHPQPDQHQVVTEHGNSDEETGTKDYMEKSTICVVEQIGGEGGEKT